ncbi:MAG TPA: hypothetical protein VII33_17895 [Nakamurella sp.]
MQLFSLTMGFEFGHVTAALAVPVRARATANVKSTAASQGQAWRPDHDDGAIDGIDVSEKVGSADQRLVQSRAFTEL